MARPRRQLDFRALAEALAEGSGMDAIAARLGVAKPTLYRMAGSRAELIRISIDAEAERLLAEVHRHGADGVFRFAEQAPAGFQVLFGGRYPESRDAVRRVESRLGRPRKGARAQIAGAGLLGLAVGLARRALEDGDAVDFELLRSDFDAVVESAHCISDRASVQAAASAA